MSNTNTPHLSHLSNVFANLLTSPNSGYYNLRSGRKLKNIPGKSATETPTCENNINTSPLARKRQKTDNESLHQSNQTEETLELYSDENELNQQAHIPHAFHINGIPTTISHNRKALGNLEGYGDDSRFFEVREDPLLKHYIYFRTYDLPEHVIKKEEEIERLENAKGAKRKLKFSKN